MKKLIASLIVFSLALLMTMPTRAQQDARYSQYMFNALPLNPGYAGTGESTNISAFYRKQWAGMDCSPQGATFNIHSALGKSANNGLGASLSYDEIGVHKDYTLYGMYAYRIAVGKGRLSIGVSGGMDYITANWNDIQTSDPNEPPTTPDPVFQQVTDGILPNFGIGLYLNMNSFYVGLSAPQLLDNQLRDDLPNIALAAKQFRHYYATVGGVIPVGESLKVVPSALVKMVPGNAPVQVDANLSVVLKDALWLGSSFRFEQSFQPESVDFIVAYTFNNKLRVSYSYDLTLTDLSAYTSGSHEVGISWDFGVSVDRYKTPRFF